MPTELIEIQNKIDALKAKKLELEKKQSVQLVKYLSDKIGNDFSASLAAIVFVEAWEKSDETKRRAWLNAAKEFRFSHKQNRSRDQKNKNKN